MAGEQHGVVLVVLSGHPGAQGLVVESVLDERLDVGLLLLHHENLFEAAGEVAGPLGAERDRHVHAHEADAGRGDVGVVGQPEPAQRLPQLPVGDPGGHDADPGVGRVDGGVVETVERGVLDGQRVAHLVDLALGVHRGRSQELAVGGVGVGPAVDRRHLHVDPGRVEVDGPAAVGDVGHDLQAGPQPGGPRQVHGVAAQVQCLAGRARIQHRYVHVGEGPGRRRRDGRALGLGVVARDHHRAAARVRSGEHAVAQGVAGPVHAGPLAVEDAQNAVVAGVGAQAGELGPHHRGGGLFLVDGGRQDDGEVGSLGDRLGDLGVVAAQGRTGVAADEGGGVQPRQPVGPKLFDRQPGQGLQAGHVDRAGVVGVAGRQAVGLGDCQGRPPGVSGRGDGAAATLVRRLPWRKRRPAHSPGQRCAGCRP